MARTRLVPPTAAAIPQQVIDLLRRELGPRARHALHRLDRTGPYLDLLLRSGLEQLAGLDGGGNALLVAEYSVDAQDVGDDVVGEQGEPIEVAEAGDARVVEIRPRELGALEQRHVA